MSNPEIILLYTYPTSATHRFFSGILSVDCAPSNATALKMLLDTSMQGLECLTDIGDHHIKVERNVGLLQAVDRAPTQFNQEVRLDINIEHKI